MEECTLVICVLLVVAPVAVLGNADDGGVFYVVCDSDKVADVNVTLGDQGFISTLTQPANVSRELRHCTVNLHMQGCTHCQFQLAFTDTSLPPCRSTLHQSTQCDTESDCEYFIIDEPDDIGYPPHIFSSQNTRPIRRYTTDWSQTLQLRYCYNNQDTVPRARRWEVKVTTKDINKEKTTVQPNGYITSPGFGRSCPDIEANYTYSFNFLLHNSFTSLEFNFVDFDLSNGSRVEIWHRSVSSFGYTFYEEVTARKRIITAISRYILVRFLSKKQAVTPKCIGFKFFYYSVTRIVRNPGMQKRKIEVKGLQTMVSDPGGTLRTSGLLTRLTNYDLVWVIRLPRENLRLSALIRFTKYQMMRDERGERKITIYNGITSESAMVTAITDQSVASKVYTSTKGFYIRMVGGLNRRTSVEMAYSIFDPIPTRRSGKQCYGSLFSILLPSQTSGFLCRNGHCIAPNLTCDGQAHCEDKSDETTYICPGTTTRRPTTSTTTRYSYYYCLNKFRCFNGRECMALTKKCDGFNDCSDNSDELNCPVPKYCLFGRCTISRQCFTREQECNGVMDCSDGSDETNCDDTRPKPTPDTGRGSGGSSGNKECYYKRCTGSDVCYAHLNECDGMNDCPNGEDERNCWDDEDKDVDKGSGSSMWMLFLIAIPAVVVCVVMCRVCSKTGQCSSADAAAQDADATPMTVLPSPEERRNEANHNRREVLGPNLLPPSTRDSASHSRSMENIRDNRRSHGAPTSSQENLPHGLRVRPLAPRGINETAAENRRWLLGPSHGRDTNSSPQINMGRSHENVPIIDFTAPPPSYNEALGSSQHVRQQQEEVPVPPPSYDSVAGSVKPSAPSAFL